MKKIRKLTAIVLLVGLMVPCLSDAFWPFGSYQSNTLSSSTPSTSSISSYTSTTQTTVAALFSLLMLYFAYHRFTASSTGPTVSHQKELLQSLTTIEQKVTQQNLAESIKETIAIIESLIAISTEQWQSSTLKIYLQLIPQDKTLGQLKGSIKLVKELYQES